MNTFIILITFMIKDVYCLRFPVAKQHISNSQHWKQKLGSEA